MNGQAIKKLGGQMKKQFIYLFIVLLIASQNFAQVKIGLMGGMNFSGAKNRQLYFYNPQGELKSVFGCIVEFPVNNNLSIRLEPQYSEKGTSCSPLNFLFFSPKAFLELSYIEIPILFNYSIGETFKPYIFAGPTFGFNTDSNVGVESVFLDIAVDANDFITDYELSFNLGGGLSYQVDELLSIFIEAKYVLGLTNVLKNGDTMFEIGNDTYNFDVPGGSKYKNRSFQVTVGFSFPLIVN